MKKEFRTDQIRPSIRKAKEHYITVNKQRVNSKPLKKNVGKISKKLKSRRKTTIANFSKAVQQPFAFTFTPAIFKGHRCSANWVSQSVFPVDFDSGITVKEAVEISKKNGLTPNIVYTSFSDSLSLRKFRFVYFLEDRITDPELCESILVGLINIFRKKNHNQFRKRKDKFHCDTKCNDLARFYFGGKKSKILSLEETPNHIMISSCHAATVAADGGRLRKLAIFGNSYNNYISSTKNNQIVTPSYLKKKTLTNKTFDFVTACKRVKILDAFAKGEWLYYPELLGIATNLHWVRGGMKWMKEVMERNNALGLTQYDDNNFALLSVAKKVKYLPQNLSKFGYEEDAQYTNIITATYSFKGDVKRLTEFKKKTLAEAERKMKKAFQKALDAKGKEIHIINIPTGIGKTEMVVNMSQSVTIAVPTHKLKDEILGRIKNRPVISTPEFPVFGDDNINQKLSQFRKIGAITQMYGLVGRVKRNEGLEYDLQDTLIAREFFDKNNQCYQSSNTVITTHAKVLHEYKFAHDTVIFDECPLDGLVNSKKFNYSKILTLLEKTNHQSSTMTNATKFLQSLNKSQTETVVRTSSLTKGMSFNMDEIVDFLNRHKIGENLIGLLESTLIWVDSNGVVVNFCKAGKLPDKKCIILSATCPDKIYKKRYPSRVKVTDISRVHHDSNIVQFTARSCSNLGLNSYVKRISKKVGEKPVLTYSKYFDDFENPIRDMYFFNLKGYDGAKGLDMAIVGTPHFGNAYYYFTAFLCGLDINNMDKEFEYRKIVWDGIRFMFNCFKERELMKIQLEFISSELKQAVGRSRPYREKVNIDIYSNLPLEMVTQFKNAA